MFVSNFEVHVVGVVHNANASVLVVGFNYDFGIVLFVVFVVVVVAPAGESLSIASICTLRSTGQGFNEKTPGTDPTAVFDVLCSENVFTSTETRF